MTLDLFGIHAYKNLTSRRWPLPKMEIENLKLNIEY